MSRIVQVESLSEFNESLHDDIEDILNKNQFNFDKLRTRFVDYPDIDEASLQRFYEAFKDDPGNEFRLATILYEGLSLTRAQASNPLYWIYINLKHFFKYIIDNNISKFVDKDTEALVHNFYRYFIDIKPSQSRLIKSEIAGLWWAVHLTIDNQHPADKYFYTKIFLSARNLRSKNMGGHSFVGDKNIFHAQLSYYNENKDAVYEGVRVGSEAMAQASSAFLNRIGGLTLLSFLDKEEIIKKLEFYSEEIKRHAWKIWNKKRISKEKAKQEQNEPQEDNEQEKKEVKKKDLFNPAYKPLFDSSTDLPKRKVVKKLSKPVDDNIVRYLYIKKDGSFMLANKADKDSDLTISIPRGYENGYLLLCSNNRYGEINRISIKDILSKSVGATYYTGLHLDIDKIESIIIKVESIIGIIYKCNNKLLFKAYLSDKIKIHSKGIGFKGYRTMYNRFDNGSIKFISLPINIRYHINRLIFDSFLASGVAYDNPDYENEFAVIKNYL